MRVAHSHRLYVWDGEFRNCLRVWGAETMFKLSFSVQFLDQKDERMAKESWTLGKLIQISKT